MNKSFFQKIHDCNNGNDTDINLTDKEIDSLKNAFESKEFRGMFAQYVEEISDPKVRAEQDAYLRQLEESAEIQVPKGKTILRPDKSHSFVVKLRYRCNDDNVSNTVEKLFINIVSSDLIEKPNILDPNSATEARTSYSLPYSLSPVRMERDKKNNLTPTFDCCFHTSALQNAVMTSYRHMIIHSAIEAVQKSYLNDLYESVIIISNESNDQDRSANYCILKGVNYVNGDPPAMMVDTKKLHGNLERHNYAQHYSKEHDRDKRNKGERQQDAFGNGFAQGFLTKQYQARKVSKHEKTNVTHDGYIEPHYMISERRNFDMADHQNNNFGHKSKEVPSVLVAKINLPNVKTASELVLDIKENSLVLSSDEAKGPKYKLRCKLPYKVEHSKSKSAKWDKKTRVLTVELPCSS